MSRKYFTSILLMGLFFVYLITGCNTNSSTPASPAGTVQTYLNALVNKDSSAISALSCGEWESSALMEYDSLQAVTVRLEGLVCSNTGQDGIYTLVNCKGKIIATYNGEDQNIDLSTRVYKVLKQNSDYLVCGYQ